MPQTQEEDTTRCSQFGKNSIQLLLVINVERTCKSNDQLNRMDFYFPYEMAKPKDLQLKEFMPYDGLRKPLAKKR
jgi:hypothetical protein